MTLEEAIEVIAQALICQAVQSGLENDEWENWDGIGEYDWDAITDRADALAPFPEPEQVDAAYKLLKARADKE